MMNELTHDLRRFGLALATFALTGSALAWVGPAIAPTGGGPLALPINATTTFQSKGGPLAFNTSGEAGAGLSVKGGYVAVGNLDAGAVGLRLGVQGAVRASSYCNQNGDQDQCFDKKLIEQTFLPPGIVLMFRDACPSGWGEFADLRGRFPFGTTDISKLAPGANMGGYTDIGGHTHPLTNTTSQLKHRGQGNNVPFNFPTATGPVFETGKDLRPLFVNVVFCRKS